MKTKNLLRGFRVQNFKAIRDSRAVPLTVFIGNNGSGKSSFIEGMETYRNIVTEGLDRAVNDRWFGLQHVWNKAAKHPLLSEGKGQRTYGNPISLRSAEVDPADPRIQVVCIEKMLDHAFKIVRAADLIRLRRSESFRRFEAKLAGDRAP